MDLKIHELSAAFPPMNPDEYGVLRSDMMLNGYDPNFPVVLYEGLILDGRHRWSAATELGKMSDVTTIEFVGDYAAARTFVVRANAGRRSMSAAQKAATAAEMVTTTFGGGGDKRSADYQSDNGQTDYTTKRAAADWGISERVISNMRQVLEHDREHGTDFHARAKAGELSVLAAHSDMKRDADIRVRHAEEKRVADEREASEKAEAERKAAEAEARAKAAEERAAQLEKEREEREAAEREAKEKREKG